MALEAQAPGKLRARRVVAQVNDRLVEDHKLQGHRRCRVDTQRAVFEQAGVEAEVFVTRGAVGFVPGDGSEHQSGQVAGFEGAHFRAGSFDVGSERQLRLRVHVEAVQDLHHPLHVPVLLIKMGVDPSGVEDVGAGGVEPGARAELFARELVALLKVKVKLRGPGRVYVFAADLGIDREEVFANAGRPHQHVVIGHEDSAARSQVVPGENKACGGDPKLVRDA